MKNFNEYLTESIESDKKIFKLIKNYLSRAFVDGKNLKFRYFEQTNNIEINCDGVSYDDIDDLFDMLLKLENIQLKNKIELLTNDSNDNNYYIKIL